MNPLERLPYVRWRVTYGNPRKGRDPLTIIVSARHAGEAKRLAREHARAAGVKGTMGTVRMLKPEGVA